MRITEFALPYPNTPQQRKNWSKWYSLNAYWSGKHWANRKKDADFWHGFVRAQLYQQKIPRRVYDCPVEITFFWNDGLDIDNHAAMAKMIVDALKGWVIENDSKRFYRRCVHDFHNEPFVLVQIKPIERNGK